VVLNAGSSIGSNKIRGTSGSTRSAVVVILVGLFTWKGTTLSEVFGWSLFTCLWAEFALEDYVHIAVVLYAMFSGRSFLSSGVGYMDNMVCSAYWRLCAPYAIALLRSALCLSRSSQFYLVHCLDTSDCTVPCLFRLRHVEFFCPGWELG